MTTLDDSQLNPKSKMKLKDDRAWRKDTYTIGKFFVNGIRHSESLEDKDRGLNSSMSKAEIISRKVYGKTAIPTGTYKVVLSVSPKFKNRAWAAKYGGLVPEILNVPGFEGIRIHPGTDENSTSGCILVGENKVKGGLVNSTKKYYELMDKYLVPAWSRKEEITITIK